MSEPGSSRTIRRNTACVACRDSKVKCDAHVTQSHTCSRCAKLQIQCVVDRSHRRTTKRSKLEELAQEVRDIKQAVAQPPVAVQLKQSSLPVVPPALQSPAPSLPLSSRRSLTEPRLPSPRTPADAPLLPIAEGSPTEPRALNSRVFSAERIEFYFDRYFEHFHPYLPVVRCRNPNQCYQSSPVLFWAIIATACRRHARDDGELLFLMEHLPSQIWAAVADLPIPLGVVQALLLVSAWPLMLRAAKDSSFVYLSVAASACFALGLHTGRGEHPEFSMPSFPMRVTEEEALFVWAGVNILSQRIAAYSGFLSVGPVFNKATDRILDDSCPVEPSSHFRVELETARFMSRFNKTIDASLEETGGVSPHLITHLEEDFETTQRALLADTGEIDRFTVLCTLLDIQICYFMPPPDFSHEALKRNVLKTYATARAVVGSALQLQRDLDFLLYAPHYVCRYLLAAMCVVLLVVLSPYLGDDATVSGAARDVVMRDAIRALRKCSILDEDMPARISKMIESYWSVSHLIPPVQIPFLGAAHQTRRLSSSLTYECLRRWRRDMQQSRPPEVSQPKPSEAIAVPTPDANIELSDPFQRIDWDALMDFDWSFAPDPSFPT